MNILFFLHNSESCVTYGSTRNATLRVVQFELVLELSKNQMLTDWINLSKNRITYCGWQQ